MKTITASPREGVTVRHPETGLPIAANSTIVVTPQIKRYIKDGDLIENPPTAKPKKKASPKKEND